jgi:hypothetical protein
MEPRAADDAVYIMLPCRDAWPSNNTRSFLLVLLHSVVCPSCICEAVHIHIYRQQRQSTLTGRPSFTATTTAPPVPLSPRLLASSPLCFLPTSLPSRLTAAAAIAASRPLAQRCCTPSKPTAQPAPSVLSSVVCRFVLGSRAPPNRSLALPHGAKGCYCCCDCCYLLLLAAPASNSLIRRRSSLLGTSR